MTDSTTPSTTKDRWQPGSGQPKERGHIVARGTVEWLDEKKGNGFIEVDGSKDVFVHVSGLAPGDWLEAQLAQIEQAGRENYPAEQIG